MPARSKPSLSVGLQKAYNNVLPFGTFFGTRYGKTVAVFTKSNPSWVLVSKGTMTSQYAKYFNSVKPPVLLDVC